jgi:cell migration-inducing and hyaluronan-binding protein
LVVVLVATLVPGASAAPQSGATAASKAGRQRWSDPATWGGAVPVQGSVVRIPSDATVVLDESTPALNGLHVDGKLVFARRDLSLRSDFIMVHGSLQVGTPGKPFTHHASITLTQEDRNADVMGMGGRLIGVMGGKVQLIGPQRDSWTQLGASAPAGSRSLQLSEDVDWRVGERIAIASTDYSSSHSEEATITAVEGRKITLDRALRYGHFGELQQYGDAVLDERAEVALLSRGIVVEGAEDSSTDGFGGQMMIEHGGDLRVRGVEFADMGQTARLRRYPVHFHMDGSARGSYIKNSAIHHSFNRCITIHGTDEVLVADNVCFDHVGHGFFLEDGAETDNVFRGNLGFRTRRAKNPLLPSDKKPATFWITNPDNTFIDNHAAGSEDFGFWYALPEHPLGLSNGERNVWPRRTPLEAFRGNTAHSNGRDGLNVDDGPRPDGATETTWYEPHSDPSDEESAPVVATFEDFTAFKNRNRGVWLRGENHVVSGAMLADNRAGATFASSESFLKDSVVVGTSANVGTPEAWEPKGPDGREIPQPWAPEASIYGFEFYDGRVGVSDSAFFDFQSDPTRGAGALGYLEPNAFAIDPRNFARNVTFERASRVYFPDPDPSMDGDLAKVFIDSDGSVTGKAGSRVVVNNPFLTDDSCEYRSGWNAHVCDRTYVSVMAGTLDGEPGDVKPVTFTRADGVQQRLTGCCDDELEVWASMVPRETYGVEFAAPTTKGVRFVIRGAPDDHVILKLERGPGFRVTRWGYPVAEAGSRAALADRRSSGWFYDASERVLYVRVDGDDATWNEIQVRPTG